MQIKQMKKKMIEYANLLDNALWKQQQADGGKAVGPPAPRLLSIMLHAH